MNDWQDDTWQKYRDKGFADRSGFGARPALLVVDFINGFTNPESPLGGDFEAELAVTGKLQSAFRERDLPIAYTTIAYQPDLRDAGLFVKKVPALSLLVAGTAAVEVDRRIRPRFDEHVLEKKFASAFFRTELDPLLQSLGVDTLVLAGCTTSGCIRATAIDSLQYGYHTIVVREAVGDRASGPHEANLFDIDAKYGDVVAVEEVLSYLQGSDSVTGENNGADDDFMRWWKAGSDTAAN